MYWNLYNQSLLLLYILKIDGFVLIFDVLVEGINDFESSSGSNGERLHALKKDHSCYSLGAFAERRFCYWN